MTKPTLIALAAAAAALTLAGCGHADDASEGSQADTVEMPADEALSNTPDPSANTAAVDSAAADATEAAEQATADQAADSAAAAAADATAAASAADSAKPDTDGAR